MRRLFPSLAIIVVVSMTPGVLELVENVGHLVGHGDTAHTSAEHGEDGEDGGEDEHGCTGTYHACACHASPHFARVSSLVRVANTVTNDRKTFFRAALVDDSGFVDGIDRPPQA